MASDRLTRRGVGKKGPGYCMVFVRAQPPELLQRFPRCHMKDSGHSNFLYKRLCQIICNALALDEVKL